MDRQHSQTNKRQSLSKGQNQHCFSEKATKNKDLLDQIEPRITRRMSKMKTYSQAASGKCVICLGNYEENYGKLPCGHMFCMECVKQWWRNHPNCPYCREEILFITNNLGNLIGFEDLPPESKPKDEDFIPHCQLCWGQIESFEPMNICSSCRSVYWHRRCLPYESKRWFCLECARPGQQDLIEEE